MSVTGYFAKNKPELKMPKSETGTDNLGTHYEGPVLSGLAGVNQQLERQAVNSSQTSAQIRDIAPGGISYLPPPASIHPSQGPRLEPDPLLAAQRHRLGGRPELCDPVLRHHIGLPPLPDPYDEQRRRAEAGRKERERIATVPLDRMDHS